MRIVIAPIVGLLFLSFQNSLCAQSQAPSAAAQAACVNTDAGCVPVSDFGQGDVSNTAGMPSNTTASQDSTRSGSSDNTSGEMTSGDPMASHDGATDSYTSESNTTMQRASPAEMAPLVDRRFMNRTTPRRPSPPSEFQNFVASVTGQRLPIYGASLFVNSPSTFAPSNLNPANADYVIGPDDELRLRIWGATSYSGNLRVDRSGSIFIPQVGAVQVAGLHFSQLDQRLRSAVAKEYKNFDLAVELGRIRSIQIYVTGQVRSPGAYTVSSLTSIVDGVFASGGPSPEGSLRHVQVKRDGKVVADIDLYKLLLQGDKSNDIPLQAEDVLYIPPVGKQVALLGSVLNPAIYELRGNETLGELLAETGGTTPLASKGRIFFDRAASNGLRDSMEVPNTPSGMDTGLADGDIIRVNAAVPAYQDTVILRGHIANPGRFTWTPGMRLSDVIPDRDSLVSRNYWWQRARLALPSPEFSSDVVAPNPLAEKLEQSVDGSNDPLVQARLRRRDGQAYNAPASLAGEDTQTDDNGQQQKLTIGLVGQSIDWNYAVIERTNPDDLRRSLLPFDLGKLILGADQSQNLLLQPGDVITIFSQGDLRQPVDMQTKYVTVEGELLHPGTYSVEPGETLIQVLTKAGGLTSKAYLYGAEFSRESARRYQQLRLDEYIQSVELEVSRGSLAVANSGVTGAAAVVSTAAQDRFIQQLRQLRASGRVVLQLQPDSTSLASLPNLELENGDHFVVPSRPATVNVVGAVYRSGVFLYTPGNRIVDYLGLAGGSNRDADAHKMFVIRADGSVENRDKVHGLFGDGFLHLTLRPGDTLVVPDKHLRPSLGFKNFLDTSQDIANLSIGAAAVSVLK